jgi:DGQHR domain-containing protein
MADLIVDNFLEIKQNNLNLYIFKLTSEEIHNNFVVSRRYEDREEGYQRVLKDSKVKNIKNYLSDIKNNYPAILPNSILIALDNIKLDNNKLLIKDNEKGYKGLIIDGQHRSEGAYFHNSSFPLVIIGISELELKYQARLFITINDTQTSLPKSLYRDLFSLISDEEITEELLDSEEIEVDIKATEIAKELTNDNESALYGFIDFTGEKQIGYISLMEFVRNVKPFINYDNGKFKEYSFRQQVKIIDNYFQALKIVYGEEWNKEKKPLFKTTIFGGLFKSLDEIWDIVIRDKQNFKVDNIKDIFNESDIKNLEELASNMGGGFKAQENYHKKFIKLIKDKLKETRQVQIEL